MTEIFQSLITKMRRPPGRQLMHVDGLPLEPAGIRRYLSYPLPQTAFLTSIFCAAGQAMFTPKSTGSTFLFQCTVNLGASFLLVVVARFVDAVAFKEYVIDKSGHAGDPVKAGTMKKIYMVMALASAYSANTLIFGNKVFKTSPTNVIETGKKGLSPEMHAVLEGVSFAEGMEFLACTGLALYAFRQIKKGNWTVTPSPPPLTQRQTSIEPDNAERPMMRVIGSLPYCAVFG